MHATFYGVFIRPPRDPSRNLTRVCFSISFQRRAEQHAMRALFSDAERLASAPRHRVEIDLADRPMLAVLYALSGAAIGLFGPVFWATLVVLFRQAEWFGK